MDDDFNTPVALAALFGLAREINAASGAGRAAAAALDAARSTLRGLAGGLGLRLSAEPPRRAARREAAPFIELLLETRAELRRAGQFALADKIRDGLSALGVSLEDGPGGTRWR
jgi:cysteinyl-tRNA synthetase